MTPLARKLFVSVAAGLVALIAYEDYKVLSALLDANHETFQAAAQALNRASSNVGLLSARIDRVERATDAVTSYTQARFELQERNHQEELQALRKRIAKLKRAHLPPSPMVSE